MKLKKLSTGRRDEYDSLAVKKRDTDLEMAVENQRRRKKPQDKVYTSLQRDKMGEAYSEIGKKGETSGGGGRTESFVHVYTCSPLAWPDSQRAMVQYRAMEQRLVHGPLARFGGKGNDILYQGLSQATKDTYNVLQMKQMHPPR
ncbi:T-cell surface glycoprotein CD3 eta chain, partial [Ophiophagus hannah]